MTTWHVVDRRHPGRDSARVRAVAATSFPRRSGVEIRWSSMMKVAFAGAFASQIAEPVRARLALPCEVMVDDEAGIVPRLADVDVLVSMGFSARMAEAAPRLRLVQVPGAGLDRIDRGGAPAGHASGERLWSRGWHRRIHHRRDDCADAIVRASRCQAATGTMGEPVGRRHGGTAALAGTGRQDPGHSGIWSHRAGGRPPRGGLRYAGLRRPATGPNGDSERCLVRRRPGAARRGSAAGRLSRRHACRSRPRPET